VCQPATTLAQDGMFNRDSVTFLPGYIPGSEVPRTSPKVVIPDHANGAVGSPIAFDASETRPSQGHTLSTFHWFFGDGSYEDSISVTSHTYTTAGTMSAGLDVSETTNGSFADSWTRNFQVNVVP